MSMGEVKLFQKCISQGDTSIKWAIPIPIGYTEGDLSFFVFFYIFFWNPSLRRDETDIGLPLQIKVFGGLYRGCMYTLAPCYLDPKQKWWYFSREATKIIPRTIFDKVWESPK
jgi:hypothetical protein